jgi:hypothetical protein
MFLPTSLAKRLASRPFRVSEGPGDGFFCRHRGISFAAFPTGYSP